MLLCLVILQPDSRDMVSCLRVNTPIVRIDWMRQLTCSHISYSLQVLHRLSCVFSHFFVEWILTDRSVFLFWHCRFQCRCPWWPHQQRPHSSCSSSRRHSSRSSLPSSSKPCSSSRKPSCYTRYYIFRNIWQTRVLSKSTSNTMSLFSFL